MKALLFPEKDKRDAADVLVIPFWKGTLDCDVKDVQPVLRSGDFKGDNGETHFVYPEGFKESKILLLGLGDKETNDFLRKAYASAVKAVRKVKAKSVNFILPENASLEAVLQGILLSNYAFDHLKGETLKDAPPLLEKIGIIGSQDEATLKEIQTIVDGVFFARDLVNGNADDITPARLGSEAKELEKISKNVNVTVFDRKWLEKEKMGLILAVGKGAEVDPVLIQATYTGNPSSKEQIVLVGKGVTYDTGGLSLKPTDAMLDMKCDMGGAAAVLGTLRVVAFLGLKVNVTALVPSVENALDSKSYKLGDVYRSYSGKTVEINNTDAEGRLILADALTYAVKNLNPSYLIDLATLTGAVVVALGENVAGLCSNDDVLSAQLLDASKDSTDALWRLPLVNEYKDQLKSGIADLINSGGRAAGSITAALFLQEFVGETKWAHLDIAGGAYLSKPRDYHPTKATGYGVQLLVKFLKKQSA